MHKNFVSIIALCFFLNTNVYAKDYVVLIHGMAKSSKSMKYLAENIEKSGYEVISIDYSCKEHDVVKIVEEFIHPILQERIKNPNKAKIHFVGHSLGGLISRYYVEKHKPKRLGRVVMIGSPNKGSDLASKFSKLGMYDMILGPVGKQILPSSQFLNSLLPKVDYEVGVIAGTLPLVPLVSLLFFDSHNDGVVTVDSTKVNGMKDHVLIKSTHNFILKHRNTTSHVINFLKNGTFIEFDSKLATK